MGIDMGYGLSIWDMVYRYGHSPHRYGHPGYRYGIWDIDMGDDSIDIVMLDIDIGYLVLWLPLRPCIDVENVYRYAGMMLALVHHDQTIRWNSSYDQ